MKSALPWQRLVCGRRFIAAVICVLAGLIGAAPAGAQQPSIEGNLAALALPLEAFPGYQVASAGVVESGTLPSHHVAYTLTDGAAILSQPFAIVCSLMLSDAQPSTGAADFLFSTYVTSFVDDFIHSAGTTEVHYEAYDGPSVAPGSRWTKLEFEFDELSGRGFLIGFPFDQGMAFAMEVGFFDTATGEDAAALAEALAVRVGAITV